MEYVVIEKIMMLYGRDLHILMLQMQMQYSLFNTPKPHKEVANELIKPK